MSFNIRNQLQNLTAYVNSIAPNGAATITDSVINATTSMSAPTITATTANITTGNFTNLNATNFNPSNVITQSIGSTVATNGVLNLTVPTTSTANMWLGIYNYGPYVSMQATSSSSVLIALKVPSLPNGFLTNGQNITVSGVGSPWDGTYSVTYGGGITTTGITCTLNNPNVITTGTTTTTLGTISYLNATANTTIGSINSSGVTANKVTSNTATALTLNSNNTGSLGEIVLQKGGTTYGTIQNNSSLFNLQLVSESGISLDSKNNKDINIAANGTGIINLLTNGVTRTQLDSYGLNANFIRPLGNSNMKLSCFYSGGNPGIQFFTTSSNSTTAEGSWGYVNNGGWVFQDGDSSAPVQTCGINTTGFYLPSSGFILSGARYNTKIAASTYNNTDMVLYNNAGGNLVFNYNGATRASVTSQGLRTDTNIYWWSFSAGSTSSISPNTRRVVLGNYGSGAAIGAHLGDFSNWAILYLTDAVNQGSSDGRYKENIVDANLDMCYDTINKIRLRRYNWIEGDPRTEGIILKDKNILGVIAQELEEILPKSVYEKPLPNSDETMKTINTDQLYFSLLGCVQSLQKKTEKQESEMKEQNDIIKAQAEKINSMQQDILTLHASLSQLIIKFNSTISTPTPTLTA